LEVLQLEVDFSRDVIDVQPHEGAVGTHFDDPLAGGADLVEQQIINAESRSSLTRSLIRDTVCSRT
jgi:hypothetical protein